MDVHFVSRLQDRLAFQDLLLEYYCGIVEMLEAAGGPTLLASDLVQSSIAQLDGMLPPDGRLALAHDHEGRLVGCGTLRRIRADAVEMKRMFVRPDARRHGLGRRLFEMRLDEARRMGCGAVYADTVSGNLAMLAMYDSGGFKRILRYPENANPVEYMPYLVYLERRFPPAGDAPGKSLLL